MNVLGHAERSPSRQGPGPSSLASRRNLRFAVAALTLAAALVTAVSGTALAESEAMSCTGTQTTNYDPGLRLFEQLVTKTGVNIFSVCEGTDQSIESGVITFETEVELSCLTLGVSGSSSNLITWNDDTTSTFSFTITSSSVGGQAIFTFTGAITDGRFDGDPATMVIVAPAVNPLECLSAPGLESQLGVSELVIGSV